MPDFDDVIEGEVLDDGLAGDAVPVRVEVRPIESVPGTGIAAVQAAALTAGGFFAGALAMAVAKGVLARRAELAPRRDQLPWRPGTSRTYVVNVRLVSRPE